jgi:hypothetical protein
VSLRPGGRSSGGPFGEYMSALGLLLAVWVFWPVPLALAMVAVSLKRGLRHRAGVTEQAR